MKQPLLIRQQPAVDGAWCVRLIAASSHVAELWSILGPTSQSLLKQRLAFDATNSSKSPQLLPDERMAAAVAREKAQLLELQADIEAHEPDQRIVVAYADRISELITNADLYEAALANDASAYKKYNLALYGEPDRQVFLAACRQVADWMDAWSKHSPRLERLCQQIDDDLPILRKTQKAKAAASQAVRLQPAEHVFKQQQFLHMGVDGFFGQLFRGVRLPNETDTVSAEVGDVLVRQLLTNLEAANYRLLDAPDGYWGLRHSVPAVVRPAIYALPAADFIGLVGHEIGSHLLERLNGGRQPLRLLSLGLAGYEKGNEGRALIREQVTYARWHDFSDRWRWYEILRRHMGISLALGLDRHGEGRGFAELFNVINQLDLLWILAHGDPDDAVSEEKARHHSWELVSRLLKGTDGTGGAYYKDIVYLQGNIACWQRAAESVASIHQGDGGKIDITNPTHLALLNEQWL